MNKFLKLAICILIPLAAGWIGSIFTTPSVNGWYDTISKPLFNPPNWIFGPVWTSLFILMGISLYLVIKNGINAKNRMAVYSFGIQLLLNVAWSFIFFGMHSPAYAFIEIIVLWLAILMNIILFYRISRKAAFLQLPYILWVSFAAVLNYFIYILN
ncbi:MAG: TspO/MBR family protein [Nanoarchaeota archaeon]